MRISLALAIAIGALSLAVTGCAAVSDDPTAGAASFRKPVGIGIDSPIRDLLDNPAALAVLNKDMPGMAEDPQLDMVLSMSLRQLATFPQADMDKAKLKSLQADLKATTLAVRTEAKPAAIATLKN